MYISRCCIIVAAACATVGSTTTSTSVHYDCLSLPRSMNGGSYPYGCPGAVYQGHAPSKLYCEGKNGQYPWWAACCHWNGSACVVPTSSTTSTTDSTIYSSTSSKVTSITTAPPTTANTFQATGWEFVHNASQGYLSCPHLYAMDYGLPKNCPVYATPQACQADCLSAVTGCNAINFASNQCCFKACPDPYNPMFSELTGFDVYVYRGEVSTSITTSSSGVTTMETTTLVEGTASPTTTEVMSTMLIASTTAASSQTLQILTTTSSNSIVEPISASLTSSTSTSSSAMASATLTATMQSHASSSSGTIAISSQHVTTSSNPQDTIPIGSTLSTASSIETSVEGTSVPSSQSSSTHLPPQRGLVTTSTAEATRIAATSTTSIAASSTSLWETTAETVKATFSVTTMIGVGSATTDAYIAPADASIATTDSSIATRSTTAAMTVVQLEQVGLGSTLANHAEEQEETLLSAFLLDNVDHMSSSSEDVAMTLHRVSAQDVAASGGYYRFEVQGSEAAVDVPMEIFLLVDEDVLILATAYRLRDPVSDSQGREAFGLVSVKVSPVSSPRNPLDIQGLQDPIKIQLTTNMAEGSCVYWDEITSLWSSAGLTTSQTSSDGQLVCSSSHLTLFGAIASGLAETFVCSQVILFSAESIGEVAHSSWQNRIDAWLLWGTLLLCLFMFLGALILDWRRSQQDFQRDELFFLLLDGEDLPMRENEDVGNDQANAEQVEQIDRTVVRRGFCIGCIFACAGICMLCCRCFGNACRKMAATCKLLCQQTIANINDFYSVLIDLYGGFEEQTELESEEERLSRCQKLWNLVLAKALTTSIRLQASSSLHMAPDDVQLFMDRLKAEKAKADVDANNARLKWGGSLQSFSAHSIFNSEDSMEEAKTQRSTRFLRAPTGLSVVSRKSEVIYNSMERFKESVREAVERHASEVESASYRTLPKIFCRIFMAKNPWFLVFQFSLYIPASMSMMLLMTEVTGEMAIAALFYRATGGKSKGGSSGCSGSGFWDALGQMLGVGIAAAFFAIVPQIVLAKMRQRDFKEFEFGKEDSIEWRRQLWRWHLQDMLVWTIGVSYICFCLFFIVIFLANVSTDHGLLWMISSALAIAQTAFLVPLLVASFLTFGAYSAARSERAKKTVRKSVCCKLDLEDYGDRVSNDTTTLRSTASFSAGVSYGESCLSYGGSETEPQPIQDSSAHVIVEAAAEESIPLSSWYLAEAIDKCLEETPTADFDGTSSMCSV